MNFFTELLINSNKTIYIINQLSIKDKIRKVVTSQINNNNQLSATYTLLINHKSHNKLLMESLTKLLLLFLFVNNQIETTSF